MEKREPALAPEWYRTGGVNSSSNSNHHHSSSSNSDDILVARSPRNRLSPSATDDIFRSPFSVDRTASSSSRRSRSTNGSTGYDHGSTRSRPYGSFNNGHRDRVRHKNLDYCDRKSSNSLDNGYNDYSDILSKGRTEKDALPRLKTKIPRMPSDSQPKRCGNESDNGFLSPGSATSSLQRSSFEREFPSLGAEEKPVPPEMGRKMPPTSLNTNPRSLPLGTSVTIGKDGWKSALAEVPLITGADQVMTSCAQQSNCATSLPVTLNISAGLNMAETLSKAPSRVCASPQLSIDTQRLEELAKKQSRQLIPVTPTTPKISVSSLDRGKAKGSRTGNMTVLPKTTTQSPSLSSVSLNRGTQKSDVPKMHQVGNFQVLNRERNGLTPTVNKIINSVATSSNSTTPAAQKLKTDVFHSFVTEKRHISQDRINFFNNIRNGSQASNSSATQEHCAVTTPPMLEKPVVEGVMANASLLDSSECPLLTNFDGMNGDHDKSIEAENVLNGEATTSSPDYPNEEEKNFLKSLGWQEDGREEALTAEEIDAFVREHNLVNLRTATI